MAARTLFSLILTAVASTSLACFDPIEVIGPETPEGPAWTETELAAIEQARAYLEEYGVRAGVDTSREELEPQRVVLGDQTRVRFARSVDGLDALAADVIVHFDNSGFRTFSVASTRSIAVPTDPAVTQSAALATAELRFNGSLDIEPTQRLVIDDPRNPRLAYEVVLAGRKPDGTPSLLHVTVDATSGNVIRSWDSVKTAEGVGHSMYYGDVMMDTTPNAQFGFITQTTDGDLIVGDVLQQRDRFIRNAAGQVIDIIFADTFFFDDDDNEWGNGQRRDFGTRTGYQTVAADAMYAARNTLDYFETVHGYRGINGRGMSTLVRTHLGVNFNNAYYVDGTNFISFGDGDGVEHDPFTTLDIVGHEFGHAVTNYTANLRYDGEAGGLNESTSDIFGVLVERFADDPRDPHDWLHGEVNDLAGNPRDFRRPSNYRYLDANGEIIVDPELGPFQGADCWFDRGAQDRLGRLDPHFSSGVGNRFFYLLSEGTADALAPDAQHCRDAIDLEQSGIGPDAAGRIWFAALDGYMTPSTNYAGARIATLAATEDLINVGALPASTRTEVANAWRQVNVRTQFIQGDANADGSLDLSDAIHTLNWLFTGQAEEPPCLQAADFNQDGTVNLSDAISSLQYLFQGGEGPEDPTACRIEDPAPVAQLSCNAYPVETSVCATAEMGVVNLDVTNEQIDELLSLPGGEGLVDIVCPVDGSPRPAACP